MAGKDYWNSIAGKKDFTVSLDHAATFQSIISPEASILDFGCGNGRVIEHLKNAGFQNICGCDFSEKMIKLASARFGDVEFRLCNDNVIPFDDNSFGGLSSVAVMTSVNEDRDVEKLFSEMFRVLKPGGLIYIADFLLNTDKRNLERYAVFEKKYNCYGTFELEPGVALRHFREEKILELVKLFENIKFETTVFDTMNGHQSNGFCFTGKKPEQPEQALDYEEALN